MDIRDWFYIKNINYKGENISEGGILVKFDGKQVARCFAVAFDYDECQYTINDTEKHELPRVKKITIEVERE